MASKQLVLANGHHLQDFAQTKHLPLYATAGQVSHISANEQSQGLKTLLCYQGYMTPESDGNHCIGASFERDLNQTQLSITAQQDNLSKLTHDTQSAPWSESLTSKPLAGKVGIRMSVKDHLPLVGQVPHLTQTAQQYHDLNKGKPATKYTNAPYYDGLYMLGGLGSRGICSAPILAEVLACQLTGEPQPLNQTLLNRLNPNRYWIKQLSQGKSLINEESSHVSI